MAEHIVPGERLEETMRWYKGFCRYYIDAHDNPDYQFAYNAFRRAICYARQRPESCQYTASELRSALRLLTAVDFLSKSSVGCFLFKTALRVRVLYLTVRR